MLNLALNQKSTGRSTVNPAEAQIGRLAADRAAKQVGLTRRPDKYQFPTASRLCFPSLSKFSKSRSDRPLQRHPKCC